MMKATKVDSKPTSFVADTSHHTGDTVDWTLLAGDERFFGAIIKATEGTSYKYEDWFLKQWAPLREAGADQELWLRGAYHYIIFHDDAAAQADYYLRTIEKADSGRLFGRGEIIPIVDVENGTESDGDNHSASKNQVIDCTSGFAERLKSVLNCRVMLYGHSAMVNLGIVDQMGCDRLWMPSYTKDMPDPAAIGWEEKDLLLWQYTDGDVNETGYPTTAPGPATADISVAVGVAGREPRVLSAG